MTTGSVGTASRGRTVGAAGVRKLTTASGSNVPRASDTATRNVAPVATATCSVVAVAMTKLTMNDPEPLSSLRRRDSHLFENFPGNIVNTIFETALLGADYYNAGAAVADSTAAAWR